MAKKNRSTLRNYFKKGSLPSEKHFCDLIDSALNVIDDGFDKSPEQGLEIAQIGDAGRLLSFYESTSVNSPVWSLRTDPATRNLIFESGERENVLSLSPEERIGIGKKNPEHALDVNGVVAARGRIGQKGGAVPANGQWHDITGVLEGCHALEVMAGVGKKRSGKYALMHAVALNTFNAKVGFWNRLNPFSKSTGKIACHQAHYDSRCNQLQLRWTGERGGQTYSLQLRTRCCYGEGVQIRYSMTELWFDPFMEKCRSGGPARTDG